MLKAPEFTNREKPEPQFWFEKRFCAKNEVAWRHRL